MRLLCDGHGLARIRDLLVGFWRCDLVHGRVERHRVTADDVQKPHREIVRHGAKAGGRHAARRALAQETDEQRGEIVARRERQLRAPPQSALGIPGRGDDQPLAAVAAKHQRALPERPIAHEMRRQIGPCQVMLGV